ncbi:hypothetical protein MUCCIDRAFT_115644 [Mucor lusitanicus CBS 277.49]|uniref:Uncharacterized protein n=1 Tax=Mucor lusitanicus CBS 277.49 TaxID=747725 RepID=A0A168GXB0_MUCCL|nr:hypothetical protein MUCCIDRAFT_115644 [Mucor lusitanicus CBS 277.49]
MVPQGLKVVLKAMFLSSRVSQVCPVSLWLVAKQHLSFTGLVQWIAFSQDLSGSMNT